MKSLCQRITDYQQPITDNQQLITDYRQPITNYRQPITDNRLIGNYLLHLIPFQEIPNNLLHIAVIMVFFDAAIQRFGI